MTVLLHRSFWENSFNDGTTHRDWQTARGLPFGQPAGSHHLDTGPSKLLNQNWFSLNKSLKFVHPSRNVSCSNDLSGLARPGLMWGITAPSPPDWPFLVETASKSLQSHGLASVSSATCEPEFRRNLTPTEPAVQLEISDADRGARSWPLAHCRLPPQTNAP